MCIYCGTTKYRKIYVNHFGEIPYDETGRSYEIHHIDGNSKNNDITNLKCVSIQEHYDIHYSQGDWGAVLRIAAKMKIPHKELSELARLQQLEKVNNKTHHCLKENSKLLKDGTHPFLGHIMNEWMFENNMHSSQRSESKKKMSESQRKIVEEGRHHMLGGEIQSRSNQERLSNGTHHCLKENNELIKNRTHHFFGGEIQRNSNKKRIEEGTHPFAGDNNLNRVKITCPHCGLTGGSINMRRYHFDKCKFKCD